MRRLVLVAGDDSRFVIRAATTLGRAATADLVANGAEVAAEHARFLRAGGCWQVIALRGTVHRNGERVRVAALQPGDRLAFGSIRFEVARDARPGWPMLSAAAVALLLLLALLAAELAGAAQPPPAQPPLQLEADGRTLRWQGPAERVELFLALYDPARSVVELHLRAPDRRGPITIEVNDSRLGAVEASAAGPIRLRRFLVPGANRLVLRDAGGGEPLRSLELRLTTTPLPSCAGAACLEAMTEALGRAERLSREREVAAGNLFDAWRWLRRARGFAIAAADADALGQVQRRLAPVEQALDERCAARRFAAARHLALGDLRGAQLAAEELLAAFPGGEHPCHETGQELVRLLEEER